MLRGKKKNYDDDLEFVPEEIESYTKFKASVEKFLSLLDQNIYEMLIEKWREMELDFLEEHSVTVRAIKAFAV